MNQYFESDLEAMSEASFIFSCQSFNESRLPHAQYCLCGYHEGQYTGLETPETSNNKVIVSQRASLLLKTWLLEERLKAQAEEQAQEEAYWKDLIEASERQEAKDREEQEAFNKAYPQGIKCSGALTGGLPNPCDTCKVQPCDYKEA